MKKLFFFYMMHVSLWLNVGILYLLVVGVLQTELCPRLCQNSGCLQNGCRVGLSQLWERPDARSWHTGCLLCPERTQRKEQGQKKRAIYPGYSAVHYCRQNHYVWPGKLTAKEMCIQSLQTPPPPLLKNTKDRCLYISIRPRLVVILLQLLHIFRGMWQVCAIDRIFNEN